jgi:Nitric oxide synthase, oxygenase domain
VDWSWIVPPAASSATPVFHRTYADFDQTPNFYHHPAPAPVPLPPTQLPPAQLAPPGPPTPLTQSPLEPSPPGPTTLTPATLTPSSPTPASPSLHELPQPADEPVALCPHQSGEHVPHLRMIEEQGGVEKQLT